MISRLSNKVADAKRREGGFTLIELLVVIIILGILAAVVVFAVRGTGDKGRSAAVKTDVKTVRTAQEAFCAKFGRYGTEPELVQQQFLSEQSTYSGVALGSGGPCKGAGVENQSAYQITCDVNAVGGSGCSPDTLALGGTLIIHNGAGVPASTLNPAITSEGGTHSNSEDMFNGLLRYESNGDIGGDLAQSFNFDNNVPSGANPNCPPITATATCDPTTTVATFVLRENVKFHNGVTLAPEDVEFSFAKAILAAHGRTRAIIGTMGVTGSGTGTVTPPEAIQIEPPVSGSHGGVVKFNLRQVFAPLKYTLNVTEAPIIPRNPYEACFNNGTLFAGVDCAANTTPVGTGPFKFSFNNNTGIETVKNPDYFRFDSFGNRLPYFDKLFKKVVTQTGVAPIQSGSVDVQAIANNERPLVQSDPNIVLTATPRGSGGGNCITTIAFNTTKRAMPNVHANAAGTVANPPPGFVVNASSDGSSTITAQAGESFVPEDVGGTVSGSGVPTTGPGTPVTITSVALGGATAVVSASIPAQTFRALTIRKVGAAVSRGGYPATSPYYGQGKANTNENASPHRILGDARVREAIFKSLDRTQFWNDVAFQAGRVADAPVHSIFQPNGAYQGPQPLPTFDRAAAGALLDAAGWAGTPSGGFRTALDHPNESNPDPELQVPDGTVLALEYLNSSTSATEPFAALVKSHLATVGINVTYVFGNNASFVAPKLFHARTYDMGQISYCNNDEPQFGVRRQYHTDNLIQTNAFTNASGYKSTMMDQLWVDASKAPDVTTYQAKFLQIQRLALGLSTPGGPVPTALETDQRVPMVQMLESAGTRGYRANCKGFNNNNTGLYMEAASCTR